MQAVPPRLPSCPRNRTNGRAARGYHRAAADWCLPILLISAIAIPLSAQGQVAMSDAAPNAAMSNRLTVADYFDWEDVSNPALSPDGKQILYTRTWIDRMNDKRESSVWLMNADGTRNRFLTKGSNAKWSPDGGRVAYTAPGEPSGSQIWVRYMDAEGATTPAIAQAPGPVE